MLVIRALLHVHSQFRFRLNWNERLKIIWCDCETWRLDMADAEIWRIFFGRNIFQFEFQAKCGVWFALKHSGFACCELLSIVGGNFAKIHLMTAKWNDANRNEYVWHVFTLHICKMYIAESEDVLKTTLTLANICHIMGVYAEYDYCYCYCCCCCWCCWCCWWWRVWLHFIGLKRKFDWMENHLSVSNYAFISKHSFTVKWNYNYVINSNVAILQRQRQQQQHQQQ